MDFIYSILGNKFLLGFLIVLVILILLINATKLLGLRSNIPKEALKVKLLDEMQNGAPITIAELKQKITAYYGEEKGPTEGEFYFCISSLRGDGFIQSVNVISDPSFEVVGVQITSKGKEFYLACIS